MYKLKCQSIECIVGLDIVPDTVRSYNDAKNGEFQKIVVFDCRGLEPRDFDPRVSLTGCRNELMGSFLSRSDGERLLLSPQRPFRSIFPRRYHGFLCSQKNVLLEFHASDPILGMVRLRRENEGNCRCLRMGT